jgi:LSD1 subclass zinc finger protein
MGLKEGSIVPVHLRCGCTQVSVTLLQGAQRIRCPKCHADTAVVITIDKNREVQKLETKWN